MLIIYNLTNRLKTFKLSDMGRGYTFALIIIAVSYIIGMLLSVLIKIDKEKKGLFTALFAFSNSIFAGLPINIALFGEISTPFVLLYYTANSTLFFTIGLYFIRRDNDKQDNSLCSFSTLKRIFSPILLAFIVAVLLVIFKIELPLFIKDSFKYVGNLTTPLSMLFIGITIYNIDYRDLKIDKDVITILLGRFVITPMIVFILFYFTSNQILMQKVFVIEAAMPVMTSIAIVGRSYGADHKYATLLITITTLASLFFIPFYMFLFQYF